jgi:hypothetical protein
MAERNVHVDPVTIWRWIQCYAPELSRRCRRQLRKTNASWRVDETYLRVAGKWTYLYRAVDSTGNTIDFLLSPKRDAAAAKRFFQKALRVSKPSTSTSRQRTRKSCLSERHCGAQANSGARPSLSLSTDSLSQQCGGARPPGDQTTSQSHAGIPLVSLRMANDPGYRNGEHDSQGTDSLAAKTRCSRSGCVHSRSVRSRNRCLMLAVQGLLSSALPFARLPRSPTICQCSQGV